MITSREIFRKIILQNLVPEPPGSPAHFPAFFVGAAVVFEDELFAHAVHESDHAQGHFAFEVKDEAEGEMLVEFRIVNRK